MCSGAWPRPHLVAASSRLWGAPRPPRRRAGSEIAHRPEDLMITQGMRGGTTGRLERVLGAARRRQRPPPVRLPIAKKFHRVLPHRGRLGSVGGGIGAPVAGSPRSPEITPWTTRIGTSSLGRPAQGGSGVDTHTKRRGRPSPTAVSHSTLPTQGRRRRASQMSSWEVCGSPGDRRWVALLTRSGPGCSHERFKGGLAAAPKGSRGGP